MTPPHSLSEFLRAAGAQTALISSPHRAVSVLPRSPDAEGLVPGRREEVWLMLGVHPRQVS